MRCSIFTIKNREIGSLARTSCAQAKNGRVNRLKGLLAFLAIVRVAKRDEENDFSSNLDVFAVLRSCGKRAASTPLVSRQLWVEECIICNWA
jgi:hypothetical protein